MGMHVNSNMDLLEEGSGFNIFPEKLVWNWVIPTIVDFFV